MKIAVTGKGGVGKTTISALIAGALRKKGRGVIAIDADPDSNLLAAMGHSNPGAVPPLVDLKDLIEERTGVKPGTTGGVYKLNPRVEDIPEKYACELGGVKVLVAGAVKKGGSGCYCPENSFVRALISHLLLEWDEDLIVDMEAGLEHLGRGTIGAVDRVLVVVEPGRRSVETALRISKMGADLGLKRIVGIGNRIRTEDEKERLRKSLGNIVIAGFVPYDPGLLDAELDGRAVSEVAGGAVEAISKIVDDLRSG